MDAARTQLECLQRGYFQIGPLVLESGDLFGLHRRFRVDDRAGVPAGLPAHRAAGGLRPRLAPAHRRRAHDAPPLRGPDAHRRRPRPTSRATRSTASTGGPPPAPARCTARSTSRPRSPARRSCSTSTQAGYPDRGEPFRSELAVTAAVSLANAVYEMGQQVGLVTNGRDAADRIRTEGWEHDPRTRQAARAAGGHARGRASACEPLVVETRRGVEQLQRIRETLARVELTDGLTFAELVVGDGEPAAARRDRGGGAADVPVETAIALGNLRRRGLAVTVVLVHAGRRRPGNAPTAGSGRGHPRHAPPARRGRRCPTCAGSRCSAAGSYASCQTRWRLRGRGACRTG